MKPRVRSPLDDPNPNDAMQRVDVAARETVALLHLVEVFCELDDRDVNLNASAGMLSTAADGLQVLMADLATRVVSMQTDATKLFELAAGQPWLLPSGAPGDVDGAE